MAGVSGWRYATVSLTFWNDLKVRKWGDDARLLALYLLTCPHRSGEGFYHLSPALAAEDLGWSEHRFNAALEVLVEDDFADFDRDARAVLIVRALKYQPAIKGPASITGALNALDKTQGSPRLFERFLSGADAYQVDFARAIRDRYRISEGATPGA